MFKVNLVVFLTIEDEEKGLEIVTSDEPGSVDLTDSQKSRLFLILAEVLNAEHKAIGEKGA